MIQITWTNYNSDAYGYKFFKVTGISTTNNTVTYDMTGISTGTFGTYGDDITLGYVVNKKVMPQFEMVLKDDVKYLSNEKVSANTYTARVMEDGWDNDLNNLDSSIPLVICVLVINFRERVQKLSVLLNIEVYLLLNPL